MASVENRPGAKPDVRDDLAHATSNMREDLNREVSEAKSALGQAQDKARDTAEGLAAEVKAAAVDKTQQAQKSIAGSLQGFGDALRAAGDQLKEKDQGQAAQMINSAAGSIDGIANSLKDKPFSDVVGEVRRFGQSNPTALIAGSVLAGLALGRFLKSSAPEASGGNRSGGANPSSNPAHRPSSSNGRYSDQARYSPPETAARSNAAGSASQTGSTFPEAGQTAPAKSDPVSAAGAASAYGARPVSSGSDTTDTAKSTYSSTSGLGGDK